MLSVVLLLLQPMGCPVELWARPRTCESETRMRAHSIKQVAVRQQSQVFTVG